MKWKLRRVAITCLKSHSWWGRETDWVQVCNSWPWVLTFRLLFTRQHLARLPGTPGDQHSPAHIFYFSHAPPCKAMLLIHLITSLWGHYAISLYFWGIPTILRPAGSPEIPFSLVVFGENLLSNMDQWISIQPAQMDFKQNSFSREAYSPWESPRFALGMLIFCVQVSWESVSIANISVVICHT